MSDDEGYVLACRVWNEMDYEPKRRALWFKIIRETFTDKGLAAPIVYPGSVPDHCQMCGVTIAVGPRQQAQRKAWAQRSVMLVCLMCTPGLAGKDPEIKLAGLGNPDDPNTGRL